MSMDIAILRYANEKTSTARGYEQRLHKSAERGISLAKTAMADKDYQKTAEQMSKKALAPWMSEVGKNALGVAGAAALVGVANAGMGAVEGAFKSLTEGRHKAKAFSEMMGVHKQLGQEDKRKVQQGFNTLWKFNPDAAQDPLLAGSFVQRTVDYGAVTTEEVGKLVAMRKAMRDAETRESTFGGGAGMGNISAGSGFFGKS